MRFRRHLCVSLLVYVFFSGVWIGPSQGADVFLEATRPDFQKIPVWSLQGITVEQSSGRAFFDLEANCLGSSIVVVLEGEEGISMD